MASRGQGYTVLVSDDEPEVVNLVTIVLESEGYQVLSASNGRVALERLATQRPDLILLDMRMPEMTGLMVLDSLGADPDLASIPVVMLSVVVTDPDVRMALERGAIAYLSKPFEIREMVWLVDRIIKMDADEREQFRQQMIQSVGRR